MKPIPNVFIGEVIEYVNDNDGVTVVDVAEEFGISNRAAGCHLLRAYNTRRVERDDRFTPHRYLPIAKQPLAPGLAYLEIALRLTRTPKHINEFVAEMQISDKRARKMLHELQDAGLAECLGRGAWRSSGLRPKQMLDTLAQARRVDG